MPGFSFLHAADLHLDSPLVGLDRYEGAPVAEIRVASRRAFEALIELALKEDVAFVVLAGDIYDGDWRDYNTGVFFNLQLSRLQRAGKRVVLANGNHDAQATMTRSLRPPDNTTVFSADRPETVRIEEHGVVLHGQSYAEQRVAQNLAAGYPRAIAGIFNIGVLHTALEGRTGHAPYAPCTLEDLTSKGYDYWALGHVHGREIVSRHPWVVFPGNLQGRHARETGSKGCSLVTVRDRVVTDVRHVALDVVRWSSLSVDVSGAASPEAVVDQLADAVAAEVGAAEGRLLSARVRAFGEADVSALRAEPTRWRAELVSRVAGVAGARVWLEKVLFDVRRPSVVRPVVADGFAEFDAILDELAASHEDVAPAFAAELARKLGGELAHDDSPLSAEVLSRARLDARELVRMRLRAARGGRA